MIYILEWLDLPPAPDSVPWCLISGAIPHRKKKKSGCSIRVACSDENHQDYEEKSFRARVKVILVLETLDQPIIINKAENVEIRVRR